MIPISAAQCRAARGWLNLSQAGLAQLVGTSRETIRQFEIDLRKINAHPNTETNIRRVFEELGLKFTYARDGRALGIECILPEELIDKAR